MKEVKKEDKGRLERSMSTYRIAVFLNLLFGGAHIIIGVVGFVYFMFFQKNIELAALSFYMGAFGSALLMCIHLLNKSLK